MSALSGKEEKLVVGYSKSYGIYRDIQKKLAEMVNDWDVQWYSKKDHMVVDEWNYKAYDARGVDIGIVKKVFS